MGLVCKSDAQHHLEQSLSASLLWGAKEVAAQGMCGVPSLRVRVKVVQELLRM